MQNLALLKEVSFGSRVAEDELDLLEAYFVETSQWRSIADGQVDIIYGPKGAGKSALYSLLLKRKHAFFDRKILLIPAENPRGAAAFQGLENDPPTSETEFVAMWKLYFVSLLADKLADYDIENEYSEKLIGLLEDAGLRRAGRSLAAILRAVMDYVRRFRAVEGNVQIDAATGMPVGLGGKISLSEPSSAEHSLGVRSVEELSDLADAAWEKSGFTVWLLLDRLDVAFADDSELEANALRALFKTYLDFVEKKAFRLKIFLRSDI